MRNEFSRSQILLGASSMEKLKNSRVAVFGLGGCGQLCRRSAGANWRRPPFVH